MSRPFYTAVVILMITHCKVKMCWALRLWAIIAALSARVCSDTTERRAVLPGVTQRHGVTPRISTLDTQNTKHQSPPEFNVMSGCFTLEGDSTLYCHIFTFIKIIYLRCSICKKWCRKHWNLFDKVGRSRKFNKHIIWPRKDRDQQIQTSHWWGIHNYWPVWEVFFGRISRSDINYDEKNVPNVTTKLLRCVRYLLVYTPQSE